MASRYETDYLKQKQKFFADPEISEKNKDEIERFMLSYDVSPARKGIFFRQTQGFLKRFPDVSAYIDSNVFDKRTARDEVNAYFNQLREQYKPSTYDTIVSVVNKLMKWLNGGVKPYTFQDIKSGSKSKRRRTNLSAKDMITKEDTALLLDHCQHIQEKAVIALQLDAGLRPSELINLRYGDIHIENGVGMLKVREGKTGERYCPVHRCLYPVQLWLNEHPSKNSDDHFFVQMNRRKGEGYTFEGIRKLIARVFKRAGLKKPNDLYNLRHSSCYQDKMENMSAELSANRHGHSINHWEQTYARLDPSDRAKQMLSHAENVLSYDDRSVVCTVCSQVNPPKTDFCVKCSNPVRLDVALRMTSRMDAVENENADLKKQLEEIQSLVNQLVSTTEDSMLKGNL